MALNERLVSGEASSDEVSAVASFQRIRRRLPWLLSLILLGGLLGLAFSLLQPPIYEARAVFMVNLDLAKTGPLDQLSQDHLIGAAYTLMGSTEVLSETLQEAQASGIPLQSLTYYDNIFIERRQSQIVLRVRDTNPESAAKIANLWADNANAALAVAADHAAQFKALWVYLTALGQCPQITGVAIPTPNICGNANYEETHQTIASLYQEAERQKDLAKGIIAELSYTLARQAQVPARPVAHGRNTAAFSGALVGFLVGTVLLSLKGARFPLEGNAAIQ